MFDYRLPRQVCGQIREQNASSPSMNVAEASLVPEVLKTTDMRTVRLTELAQRVGRTASIPVSPLPNPMANGGVLHTPSGDIANWACDTCKVHPGKALAIKPVAVSLDLLHGRKQTRVETIMGSVVIAHIIASRGFILKAE